MADVRSVCVRLPRRPRPRARTERTGIQDDYRDERGFGLGFLDLPAEGVLSHSCAIFTSTNQGSLFTAENYLYADGADGVRFGEWSFVACTYDGLTVSLYVDGELVSTSGKQIGDILYPAEDYSAKHSSSLLTLGAFHDQNDYFTVHGELDEAMILDCAVTAEEIRAASAGRSATLAMVDGRRECLMHFFRFNEEGGDLVVNEGRFEGVDGYIVDPLGSQVYRENSVLP